MQNRKLICQAAWLSTEVLSDIHYSGQGGGEVLLPSNLLTAGGHAQRTIDVNEKADEWHQLE